MTNLTIHLPLVDGSGMPVEYETGKELIQGLISDDISPPPTGLNISITHTDGKIYTIHIPYSNEDKASLFIKQ